MTDRLAPRNPVLDRLGEEKPAILNESDLFLSDLWKALPLSWTRFSLHASMIKEMADMKKAYSWYDSIFFFPDGTTFWLR